MRTAARCIVLALLGASCRIRSGNAAYWQETRGHQHFRRITATRKGALVMSDEGNALYHYPGKFGMPWVEEAKLDAALVAGSPTAIYVVDGHGALRRREGEGFRDYPGSDAWKIGAVAASDTDALYVIADGHVRAVQDDRLGDEVCPGKPAKAMAASGSNVVWIVDEAGALLRADRGSCAPFDAPPALSKVSAFGPMLTVANEEGTAFRLLETAWQELGAPMRYRPDQFPERAKIVALAQSELWLWAMDEQGFIHFLSDPT